MSEKPSLPKPTGGFVGDSMSTANFQTLGAAKAKAAKPSGTHSETAVTRADSMPSANFQALASRKPAAPTASAPAAAPTPAKGRPAGR
jgi:hypothetical protein